MIIEAEYAFTQKKVIIPVRWTRFSTEGIPMGRNCGPLLADLFLHSYEAEFIADLIRKKEYLLAKINLISVSAI